TSRKGKRTRTTKIPTSVPDSPTHSQGSEKTQDELQDFSDANQLNLKSR
ncbi:7123_t:CDS:1, partial [Dentiscutata erythropus]